MLSVVCLEQSDDSLPRRFTEQIFGAKSRQARDSE
jgi:hypothetical protein